MAPTMECPGILHFRFGGEVDDPAGPDHRHQARGAGQDRRLRRVPRSTSKGKRDPAVVRGPRGAQDAAPRPGRCSRNSGEPKDDHQAFEEELREADGRAGARPRRDHRLCAGDLSTGKGQARPLPRPARDEGRPALPPAGETKSEAGFDDLHHRRLLQERHERVRLDPRLCAARGLQKHAAPVRSREAAARSTRSRSRSSRASTSTSWPRSSSPRSTG